jgi:hypothetical protein
MCLAYQKKLMGKSINFLEIKNEIAQFDKLQDSIYDDEEMENIKNHMDTAKYNFERFQIGDTLHLELSLNNDGRVYYVRQYYKNNFKDTLFMKGVILKKMIEKAGGSNYIYDYDEYWFAVKVLEISNKYVDSVNNNMYNRGNVFTLLLNEYGGIIKK